LKNSFNKKKNKSKEWGSNWKKKKKLIEGWNWKKNQQKCQGKKIKKNKDQNEKKNMRNCNWKTKLTTPKNPYPVVQQNI
jgi:hypothetical protein